jgi:MFS family permease
VVHPVFGALIDRVDWPRAFVITGGLTALLALAWFAFAKDHPASPPAARLQSPDSPGEKSSLFSMLKQPGLVLLTLSYSTVGYFQYLFFYWLHYYFDTVLHMDKADSRFYAGLPNLAMACAMPVGGWLADRAERWRGSAGRALVPQTGMALSALFLLFGIFAQDRTWVVVWFTLSLGVLGLCEATFWTMAVELGGARGGTAAAIMNTGGNGIGLLAPMITPAIGQWLGWGWGIGLGAIIGLLGALCWRGIRPGRSNSGGEAS